MKRYYLILGLLIVLIGPTPVFALQLGEGIEALADRLETDQVKIGSAAGTWFDEELFTGSIVAGMAEAYQATCESDYKVSAELGGEYILQVDYCNLYGDEAYALMKLSEIAPDPCDNKWRTALEDYFYCVEIQPDGTEGYIADFYEVDPSRAVLYLSYSVIAAYYVDANDKEVWRLGLTDWLASVDDNSDLPVLAMGAATWALATSADLDASPIDRFGTGASYWFGQDLEDLPGLLLGHQVPSGGYADSFYWRFGHDNGGYITDEVAGYSEDTLFGTLGLAAANKADPDLNIDPEILAAQAVMLDNIGWDGIVYEHLWVGGEIYYTYAGRMLMAFYQTILPGDLNLANGVDFVDYSLFAQNYGEGCTACEWCNCADMDKNAVVDANDLKILAESWLLGAE